jgi:hypothetical protein
MDDQRSPDLTRVNPLVERLSHWVSGTPRGQRLRELAAAGVIGRLAPEHYGFGPVDRGAALIGPGREVAARLYDANVDLALLVPA